MARCPPTPSTGLTGPSSTDSPAVAAPPGGVANRFFFSPLRADLQLFTFPREEAEVTSLATPLNVPDPVSRGVMHRSLSD